GTSPVERDSTRSMISEEYKEGWQNPRRPRVLLTAFSCGPNRGSEPGIGWWRAVEIARHCQVWALVEGNEWEESISAYLKRHGPIANLEFVFVPGRWRKGASTYAPGLAHVMYRLWHRRAYRVAERLHAQVNFDIAHQSPFASCREPGHTHRLGIPFVWGPIGGAQNYPWRFLR